MRAFRAQRIYPSIYTAHRTVTVSVSIARMTTKLLAPFNSSAEQHISSDFKIIILITIRYYFCVCAHNFRGAHRKHLNNVIALIYKFYLAPTFFFYKNTNNGLSFNEREMSLFLVFGIQIRCKFRIFHEEL